MQADRSDEGRSCFTYHRSDGSPRWIAPPGVDQEAWTAQVRAHQAWHRESGMDEVRRSPRGQPRPRAPRER